MPRCHDFHIPVAQILGHIDALVGAMQNNQGCRRNMTFDTPYFSQYIRVLGKNIYLSRFQNNFTDLEFFDMAAAGPPCRSISDAC
jgi:hypothetical protein